MASIAKQLRCCLPYLVGLGVMLPLGAAMAWQAAPPARPVAPVLLPPPPQVRFQQVVHQQQINDQLQKSQMQQQLQQGVSDTAKRPLAADSPLRKQADSADQARQERERARQRDLQQRYQNAAVTPAAPTVVIPAPTHSGH